MEKENVLNSTRLISLNAAKDVVCKVTNSFVDKKRKSVGDIQKLIIYELGLLESVGATEDQLMELNGGEIKFEDDQS